MPNLTHGLDPTLKEIAAHFDEVCRKLGALYTIEQDTHNEQGYAIRNQINVQAIAGEMSQFIADKWVDMAIEEGVEGPYIKFCLLPIFEYSEDVKLLDLPAVEMMNQDILEDDAQTDKWVIAISDKRFIPPVIVDAQNRIVEGTNVYHAWLKVGGLNGKIPAISEDQIKSPNRAHSRRQAANRGAIGKLSVFGNIIECKIGDKFKLTKDLMGYDNVTIVPAGTEVEVVDNDPRVPDIKYEGKIINVSMDKLMKAINDSFERRLSKKLDEAVVAGIPSILVTKGLRPAHHHSELEHAQHNPLIRMLNELRAAEIVAALQYEIYSITVPSLHMQGLEDLFEEHEEEERKHAKKIAQRIHELDGEPVADPVEISKLSPYQISYDVAPEAMVKTLLEQERIGLDSYRKAIEMAKDDPATRLMLEEILRDEEEHTADMKSMLEHNK